MKHPQLIYLITTIASVLAEGKTTQEISLLAVVFSQLGDTLATIAMQKEFCESSDQS